MTKLLLQVVLFHLIRLCLCFENYQLGKLGAMIDLDQGGPNSLGGPNFSGGGPRTPLHTMPEIAYIYRYSDINYIKKRKSKTCTIYCKSDYIHQINYEKLISGLQLFCNGPPSCKNNFIFGLGHVLNMPTKCS